MSLLEKFDELMSHLNSEENSLAGEFRKGLIKAIDKAEDDANWRSCLEAGGVDNWEWFGDCFPDDEDEDNE